MKRFEKQVAVVSGGAEGIGKGIAERLLREGANVVLFDINAEMLGKTVKEFAEVGLTAVAHTVDISKPEQVINAFAEVERQFGKLDIMINSAGIVGPTGTKIVDYEVEEFDKIYSINLRGAFLMTKYAIVLMEKNKYGRVLLIASIAGKDGNPFMAGYTATKAGVAGLVKGIGKEYAETGITVNGLAPAVIKTAMNSNTAPEQLAYMTEKIPMKRLGTVDEVASLACWIVSQEASFNTACVFDISGGRATY